jgi:hypothetical protein
MKYFKPQELVDRGTFERMGDNALSLFSPEVLIALDDLREYFNTSITVNNWSTEGQFQWRGWRTPEKARELSSPNSQHAKGNAFDCTIKWYTAAEARKIIVANQNHELLKRITRLEDGVSWLHFDCMVLPVNKKRIYLFKV